MCLCVGPKRAVQDIFAVVISRGNIGGLAIFSTTFPSQISTRLGPSGPRNYPAFPSQISRPSGPRELSVPPLGPRNYPGPDLPGTSQPDLRNSPPDLSARPRSQAPGPSGLRDLSARQGDRASRTCLTDLSARPTGQTRCLASASASALPWPDKKGKGRGQAGDRHLSRSGSDQ